MTKKLLLLIALVLFQTGSGWAMDFDEEETGEWGKCLFCEGENIPKEECPILSCGHSGLCSSCIRHIVNFGVSHCYPSHIKCPVCLSEFSTEDVRRIVNGDPEKMAVIASVRFRGLVEEQGGRFCSDPGCDGFFLPDPLDDSGLETSTCLKCGNNL